MKNQNEKTVQDGKQSKTNEAQAMNLQNIIVVGECKGTYANASVTKEFQAKVLVSARPDGTVIVHNLGNGVRPLCYIDGGAEISIARNLVDAEIEFFATTEDGQQLTLQFTEVVAMQGIPSGRQTNSLAMSILKCVFDMGGNYGRTTIARVLTGSVSKKILTINISKLGTYGVAKDASMKEVLSLIDWLIQENYLAYVEDSEFPVLVVTSKGLDVLAGGEVPVEARSGLEIEEVERRKAALKEWRDRKSAELGKPRYFVMRNRTIAEIASKAPKTMEELQGIYGIGEALAQRYGAEILDMFSESARL
jgi:hypothetical protein